MGGFGSAADLLVIRERSRIIRLVARKQKNRHAVALGRRGGRKGGAARAANMTPEERSKSARGAVTARWAKVKTRAYSQPLKTVPKGPDLVTDARTDKFQDLVRQWRIQRGATSSITEMAMLPAYQKIIGMGKDAIPLIIKQLKSEGDEPDQWFWALRAITDVNPVSPENQGNSLKMAEAWLRWAAEESYAG